MTCECPEAIGHSHNATHPRVIGHIKATPPQKLGFHPRSHSSEPAIETQLTRVYFSPCMSISLPLKQFEIAPKAFLDEMQGRQCAGTGTKPELQFAVVEGRKLEEPARGDSQHMVAAQVSRTTFHSSHCGRAPVTIGEHYSDKAMAVTGCN